MLSSFIDVRTASDFWNTATPLFAAVTGAKLSRIRHELYSLKKGTLTIIEYVVKIQNTCALIEASGSRISKAKKVEIVLVGLPPKFDTVITLASFSSEPLPFHHLVDVLPEYDNWQMRVIPEEVLIHANFVESVPLPLMVASVRCGRPPSGGRDRGFRSRIQC